MCVLYIPICLMCLAKFVKTVLWLYQLRMTKSTGWYDSLFSKVTPFLTNDWVFRVFLWKIPWRNFVRFLLSPIQDFDNLLKHTHYPAIVAQWRWMALGVWSHSSYDRIRKQGVHFQKNRVGARTDSWGALVWIRYSSVSEISGNTSEQDNLGREL